MTELNKIYTDGGSKLQGDSLTQCLVEFLIFVQFFVMGHNENVLQDKSVLLKN